MRAKNNYNTGKNERCLEEKSPSFSHSITGDVCIINDCYKHDTNPSMKSDKGFKYIYYELIKLFSLTIFQNDENGTLDIFQM